MIIRERFIMGRQITITLTPELLIRSMKRCEESNDICSVCLIATALQEADDDVDWRCGRINANNYVEDIAIPYEIQEIIELFTSDKEKLMRRLEAGEELYILETYRSLNYRGKD